MVWYMLSYIILYYITLYYIILYYIILYYIILYYIILYYIILYYIILYYIILLYISSTHHTTLGEPMQIDFVIFTRTISNLCCYSIKNTNFSTYGLLFQTYHTDDSNSRATSKVISSQQSRALNKWILSMFMINVMCEDLHHGHYQKKKKIFLYFHILFCISNFDTVQAS